MRPCVAAGRDTTSSRGIHVFQPADDADGDSHRHTSRLGPALADALDPVATTPPGDASVTACGDGGTASITGAERSVRVEGTCAQVTVSGSALTVDATAATIGALAMSGDRLRVTAAGVDTATIQGNDTALAVAGALGRLDLSGDRATVSAGGAVGSLLVRGQDNAVTAGGGIGDSTVEGRGNRVG